MFAHPYVPNRVAPLSNNPYYISNNTPNSRGVLGNNPCTVFSGLLNVLPNCTGYVIGRWDEICSEGRHCELIHRNPSGGNNANRYWQLGVDSGLVCDQIPEVGAIMCWSGGKFGHVAIVERVISSVEIEISESSYSDDAQYRFQFAYSTRIFNKNKKQKWIHKSGADTDGLYLGSSYVFEGFIHHPYIKDGMVYSEIVQKGHSEGNYIVPDNTDTPNSVPSSGGPVSSNTGTTIKNSITGNTYKYTGRGSNSSSRGSSGSNSNWEYTTVDTYKDEVVQGEDVVNTQGTSLLSYPSAVESPFIIVKIGNYTFGSYTKRGSIESQKANAIVDYPNYLQYLNVVKVDGTVNTYTIGMTYQIQNGADPNLLDRIFSSVGYGTIKISYGDWQSPTFIYREEEAIITKLQSSVDFSSSRINYTLSCTSNSLSLAATTCDFPAKKAKPSDVIKDLLYNRHYGLLDIFYGMKNRTLVTTKNLIPGDDNQVELEPQIGSNPISYLNYLVSCMTPNTSDPSATLKDGIYKLSIVDDAFGDLGGPYFKIQKISTNQSIVASSDTYVIDVGYPSNNQVMDFKITNDNSWDLLYDYNKRIDQSNYVYYIDNDGNIVTKYSQNLTTSTQMNKTTELDKNWWSQMTQFPITASIRIKGLIRPAMLMTYIKINAVFFGQRHISSGLYIVTRQEDTISGAGYSTTLSLTRIAGDLDYIVTKKESSLVAASRIKNVKV